jgi:hypothetical protein
MTGIPQSYQQQFLQTVSYTIFIHDKKVQQITTACLCVQHK